MNEEIKLALQSMLLSQGWREVMAPALRGSIEHVKTQMVLRPSQRAGDFKDADDEYLRGMYQALTWTLNSWESSIAVYDQNQKVSERNGVEPESVGSPYGAAEGAEA